jgi:hypothetical protein
MHLACRHILGSRSLFLLCIAHLALAAAPASTAQTLDPAARVSATTTNLQGASIQAYLTVLGWTEPTTIQSATAIGTVVSGSEQQPITIRIDRRYGIRVDLPAHNIVLVAGPSGGLQVIDGIRHGITPDRGAQLAASPLIPVFTPLAELSTADVLAGYYSGDANTITFTMAKRWHVQDGSDNRRAKASLYEAVFDRSTHLLTRLDRGRAVGEGTAFSFSESARYADYRKVGSMLLPFQVTEYLDEQLQATVTFSSITTESALDPSMFAIAGEGK